MALSFAADVAPFLAPYRENMLWRFDVTDYDAVKANAVLIYGQIAPTGSPPAPPSMPPAPLPPLEPADIATFKSWMDEGCPP